jgi:hypothetical protein
MAFDDLKCLTFKLEARSPQNECYLGFLSLNFIIVAFKSLIFSLC